MYSSFEQAISMKRALYKFGIIIIITVHMAHLAYCVHKSDHKTGTFYSCLNFPKDCLDQLA